MSKKISKPQLGAVRTDAGKAEMIYFYVPGFVALARIGRGPYSKGMEAYDLLEDFHADILLNLGSEERLMFGLRNLEGKIIDTLCKQHGLQAGTVIQGVCQVCKLGSIKYGFLNYTKGFDFSRVVNSLGRHLEKNIHEERDYESGECHLFHALANVYILAEHIANGTGNNDVKVLFKRNKGGDNGNIDG